MHDKDPNPCSEARLNANFHLSLESWSKKVLDFAFGESFILAPHE
jgi:hypothetical protein